MINHEPLGGGGICFALSFSVTRSTCFSEVLAAKAAAASSLLRSCGCLQREAPTSLARQPGIVARPYEATDTVQRNVRCAVFAFVSVRSCLDRVAIVPGFGSGLAGEMRKRLARVVRWTHQPQRQAWTRSSSSVSQPSWHWGGIMDSMQLLTNSVTAQSAASPQAGAHK